MKREWQRIVSRADIARRAGVTPDAVAKWQQRHPDFPAPVARTAGGAVWDWGQVEAWLRKTGRVERLYFVGDGDEVLAAAETRREAGKIAADIRRRIREEFAESAEARYQASRVRIYCLGTDELVEPGYAPERLVAREAGLYPARDDTSGGQR